MKNRNYNLLISLFVFLLSWSSIQCTSVKSVSQSNLNNDLSQMDGLRKNEKKINEYVWAKVNQMSLEQKIGQMLMPSIYKGSITKITPSIKSAIEKYGFGGVIFFKSNIVNTAQTMTFINDIQTAAISENSISKIPLFLGIDQEGGAIVRLNNACRMPGNMLVGATGNPEYSRQYAALVGSELNAIGFNVNFAPCADVNSNPANPIIGLRSFASKPELVGKMVGGSIKGYFQSNVVSALKHFPGHGDTVTDSHYGLPLIEKSFDELKGTELVPFEAGIKSGADMIMTAHIQFPDLESETYKSISNGTKVYLPATLSKKIITGVLREQLKFDGVVITDAMDMNAITTHFRKMDSVKLAINAGVDILLMACDLSSPEEVRKSGQMISSIAELVRVGEISEETINESVFRILRLKYKYGILDWTGDLENRINNAETFVSSLDNHKKEWAITENGITVVKNEKKLLPLSVNENSVGILYPYSSEYTSIKYGLDYVKQKTAFGSDVSLINYSGKSFDSVSRLLSKLDVVVIISELSEPSQFRQFNDGNSRFAFVRKVIENQHRLGKKVVLISADLPYDIAAYSDADAILAIYGSQEMKIIPGEDAKKNVGYGPNIPVSIASIFGAAKANGKLPVDIFALDEKYNYTKTILYPAGTCAKFN